MYVCAVSDKSDFTVITVSTFLARDLVLPLLPFSLFHGWTPYTMSTLIS